MGSQLSHVDWHGRLLKGHPQLIFLSKINLRENRSHIIFDCKVAMLLEQF